jgi:hypothetical protein
MSSREGAATGVDIEGVNHRIVYLNKSRSKSIVLALNFHGAFESFINLRGQEGEGLNISLDEFEALYRVLNEWWGAGLFEGRLERETEIALRSHKCRLAEFRNKTVAIIQQSFTGSVQPCSQIEKVYLGRESVYGLIGSMNYILLLRDEMSRETVMVSTWFLEVMTALRQLVTHPKTLYNTALIRAKITDFLSKREGVNDPLCVKTATAQLSVDHFRKYL